ncbi:hypothetical protein B9Z55_016130 [Caenorhabditis nigoni]|uniref:Uncharacterized protein n=1 Tax=Caenorhabditis nigoni TaxID=1611254 RepID=A0A2G5UDA4_9PELO|nr:hypothetical protein B9Z55_016130 [Caenorhabditis nigoni]
MVIKPVGFYLLVGDVVRDVHDIMDVMDLQDLQKTCHPKNERKGEEDVAGGTVVDVVAAKVVDMEEAKDLAAVIENLDVEDLIEGVAGMTVAVKDLAAQVADLDVAAGIAVAAKDV